MSNENAVRNLIRIDDKDNPELFRAIQLLIEDVYKAYATVFPIDDTTQGEQQGPNQGLLPAVENFTGTAYPDNLRLDWDNLPGAFRYQIRMGNDWDTAKYIITTATDVANIDPIYLNLVYGTYPFIIRAMGLDGRLGAPSTTVLVVPQIPPPNLNLDVVVSTVMLRWTIPVSAWRIDYYNIYKNGVKIGSVNGTFKLLQESAGGTYLYSVEAVDIVGNVSTMSAQKIADLHDPSEFEFVDEISAQYNGIYDKTAFALINGIPGVVGPTQVHTWQEHYEFYGFISPQDQVDQGYPIYWQPGFNGEGTYEETFDFGTVYHDLTIVLSYNKLQLAGDTLVIPYISYSEDGITWTPEVPGTSVLADVFRYVKVKFVYTNADDLSLAFVSNIRLVLNVTLTLDSGSVDALDTDAGGTLVTYNKDFIGISSVTATPSVSLQPLYAVCDQITPDNFRVLVFDSSGNRRSASINWKARGVV